MLFFNVRFHSVHMPLPPDQCDSSMEMGCSSGWHRAGRCRLVLVTSQGRTTPLQTDSRSLSEGEGERERGIADRGGGVM